MTDARIAVDRVRSLVRAALADGRAPEVAPVSDEELVSAILRHRVAEVVLGAAVEAELATPVRQALRALALAARRDAAVQVLETGRISRLLTDAGLAHLCIKGPALAVQTTGSTSARGAGDIDLLVAPEAVPEAHRLLVGDGWVLQPANAVSPGTWAWRHVLRAFNELSYRGPRGALDLHWRLDPSPHGLPGFEEVWGRRVTVDLSGVRVATLGPQDALAHSCFNAAKDGHRWLRSLVDVHRLAALPAVWDRVGSGSLSRLERSSLAVTRAAIGLPAGVPTPMLRQIDSAAMDVAGALRRQAEPTAAPFPFPGAESTRLMRHLLRAGGPRDLGHALLATALPVLTVVGIEDRTAWTGVPRVMVGRARRGGRRTVAWTRRVPGAGVAELRR